MGNEVRINVELLEDIRDRLNSELKTDFHENYQANMRLLGSLMAYYFVGVGDEDRQRIFDCIISIADDPKFNEVMKRELAMLMRTQ